MSATASNPYYSDEDNFKTNLPSTTSTFTAGIKINVFEKQDDESLSIPTHISTAERLLDKKRS